MQAKTILLVAFFAILAACLSVKAEAPPTSEVLWDRYQNVLLSFIRKSTNDETYKGLQVVTEPLDATWDEDPTVLSILLDKAARYGSIYEPSSLSLSQEYESFLFNLKFPETAGTAADKKKLSQLRDEIAIWGEKRFDAELACYSNYEFMKLILDNSYDQYKASYCASSLAPIQKRLDYLNSDLVTYTTKVDGPNKGIVEAVSRFISDPSVGKFTETKTTLATFLARAKAKTGTPITFALNSKTTLSESRKWIKKKKSGFAFFKKKSTTIKTEFRFQSEHFNMKIAGESFARIEVAPKGDWFSRSVVKSYFNKKTMWENQNKSFFGQNGSLTLVPKAVYVMFNPKIELECGEKDAYTLHEMKQTSFSFGPFSSNKGSTLDIKQENEKNYRVTFNSNSNTAQIIAIDYDVFE